MKLKFQLLFLLVSINFIVYSQNKIYYTFNNIKVETKEESQYFGELSYPTKDSNQVILTKYYEEKKPMSRTFYYDYRLGIKHQQQMLFHKNGKIAQTVTYNYDTLQGPSRNFNEKGELTSEYLYYKGKVTKINEIKKDSSSNNFDGATYNEIEEMPVFPGCAFENREYRNQCSSEKIYKTIFSNVKYPAKAKKDRIEGTVYVKFIITEEGLADEFKIIKRTVDSDVFDEAVFQALFSLPKMIPGTQYGEPVRVQYNIPIKFHLNGSKRNYNDELPDLDRPGANYIMEHYTMQDLYDFREMINKSQNVDRMPMWVGCEVKGNKESEDDCTEWRMTRFLNKKVIYPTVLKKDNPKDVVKLTIEINEKGEAKYISLSKASVYSEMNEAAIEVIKLLPTFKPATKKGVAMPYRFIVSVNFNNRFDVNR